MAENIPAIKAIRASGPGATGQGTDEQSFLAIFYVHKYDSFYMSHSYDVCEKNHALNIGRTHATIPQIIKHVKEESYTRIFTNRVQ